MISLLPKGRREMRSQKGKSDSYRLSRKEARENEQGFTLTETAIAMVVMMVATLAAASLFVYAVGNNSGAGDRALAAAIAQQQLERLRTLPFTHASLNATTGTTTTVPRGGRSYNVRTIITNTSSTLKTITIQVTPQNTNAAWALTPVVVITQRASVNIGPN